MITTALCPDCLGNEFCLTCDGTGEVEMPDEHVAPRDAYLEACRAVARGTMKSQIAAAHSRRRRALHRLGRHAS